MLSAKIPSFGYNNNIVLQNIQHNFETSKTHGIVGLNGAGKTTFFNLLSGHIKDEECQFSLNGQAIKRSDIAFLDTELYLYPKLTAREFLSVFPTSNKNYNEQNLAEILRLPLDGLTDEFSTGMKKKLLLLSQLKQDKQIFILDEPFNGLDIETNKILEVIIKVLNSRGKTVFISSHILEPLFNICHQIHHISNKNLQLYNREDFNKVEDVLFGDYKKNVQDVLTLNI